MVARRLMLVAVLFATAAGPLAREAGAQDPRLRALRGIEGLQIFVSAYSGSGSGSGDPRALAPCPLDTATLERRGADTLRAVGLSAMTFAETMARVRANMAEDRRRLQALRAGDLEGARERPGAVVSTRNLPVLKVTMVSQAAEHPAAGLLCSVAAFAAFVAPPRDTSTIVAANNVAVGADLVLWEPSARLVVVPGAELEAAAGATLDRLVAEFVGRWRAQNGP
jgi:hypothetical protein